MVRLDLAAVVAGQVFFSRPAAGPAGVHIFC
jgi:hypothetical protein